MRTTLTIDDDVLLAAKSLGRREGKSTGQKLSELARQGLQQNATGQSRESRAKYGFEVLPAKKGTVVTNELIDQIREEEGV